MPRTSAPRRPGRPRSSSAIAPRRPTFTRCPRRPTQRALAPPCKRASACSQRRLRSEPHRSSRRPRGRPRCGPT
eukprot:4905042-Prymnesium_polylepis.1